MNHPGVYITILYLGILCGSIALVNHLKDNGGELGGYVCPPCGCGKHDEIHDKPGICSGCKMPLISVARTKSKAWSAIFTSREVNFYHHKLFYPVNFLAMFIGIFALFRYKRELPMVLFLILFLSLVFYSFHNQLYGTSYSMQASRQWAFFPISFLLATGPALYLYFSKTLNPSAGFTKKDALHFLPAALVFTINVFFFFASESLWSSAFYNNYDHFPGLAEQLTFLCSGSFYFVIAGRIVREGTHLDFRFHRWQKQLRVFVGLVIIGLAVMVSGNYYFFDLMSTWLDYHPVFLVIAAFTLWSAYVLVFKKEVIVPKTIVKENRLPADKITAWMETVDAVMQTQKPYLQPDLTLQTLAQIVGIKEKDLSEVLNAGFSQSFHDYVNQYRIEEVKKILLNPEKQHLTNVAMAQECGFNSKSAFFSLFKKHVGMTPGEYKRSRTC